MHLYLYDYMDTCTYPNAYTYPYIYSVIHEHVHVYLPPLPTHEGNSSDH